jgi:hypothetical protein
MTKQIIVMKKVNVDNNNSKIYIVINTIPSFLSIDRGTGYFDFLLCPLLK